MQHDASATKWKLGDMLWAKVSGHPWWPCIVLPDPDQSAWSKPLQSMTVHFFIITDIVFTTTTAAVLILLLLFYGHYTGQPALVGTLS